MFITKVAKKNAVACKGSSCLRQINTLHAEKHCFRRKSTDQNLIRTNTKNSAGDSLFINIYLGIQFDYIQYNQKLEQGKQREGVSFYLLKLIKTLIFPWYFPTNHILPPKY